LSRGIMLLIIACIIILSGCKQNEHITEMNWFDTKEKAIEEGLNHEGADKSAILASNNVNGETIIFYEYQNSLGVASIAESEERYSWYRSQGNIGFQGEDVPYMTLGFEFQTYKKQKIKVIAGRVYNESIEKMILIGDGVDRELTVNGTSRLFFSIYKSPFNSLSVSPSIT
jgi:hypothetical protein